MPVDGAGGGELARLVEALLKTPQNELELPPRLARLYLQSRWPSRRRLLHGWLVGLAAVNALLAPFDPFLAPAPGSILFAGGRLFVSLLLFAFAAVIARMETCGREGLLVTTGCVAMALLSAAALPVDLDLMRHAFAHAMFAGAASLVVARISWRDTLILAAALGALLVAIAGFAPGLSAAERGQTIALYGCAIVGFAWVRKVQNRFLYRVFLEGLRERLKGDEIKSANDHLAAMARTDHLTLLPNRRHCDEVVEALAADAQTRGPAALFMIDVDFFKLLNDDRGHAAGDDCLREVAGLIRAELRGGQDFLARFGGEEFVAILPEISAGEAFAVAERVRAAVQRRGLPHRLSPHGVVTVSLGVAMSPPTAARDLVTEADAALYAAKAAGRNRVRPEQATATARVA